MASLADQLPPSLNLPPHLSAHKYFFVCTLTVAAWDTLVLSPRTWRLFKMEGWPVLKVLFMFMRHFMPAEFIVVAVAFFDTNWTQDTCNKFYLFEPICTAILLAACSAVHVVRIHAIYEKNRIVLFGLGGLFAVQVVVTAICCGFYKSVFLDVGQGCIAGPKANWVGIYWLAPTLLYTASFALALIRSRQSLAAKPLSPWKLMLRDGLNLYGAIWLVNMVNMLFWFVMKETTPKTTPTSSRPIEDSVKTIVTSMAAVLTTSMTLRIILSVRGSLVHGGSFAGASSAGSGSRTTHVLSSAARSHGAVPVGMTGGQTFDLSQVSKAAEGGDWNLAGDGDRGSINGSEREPKVGVLPVGAHGGNEGVKITVDQEVEYDTYPRAK